MSDTRAQQAMQWIGLLVVAKVAWTFLSGFYAFFLRGSKNLTKMGKWAVVTGATDGIGKATALELARKGMSIVLISRTQSKLDDVSREILSKYSTIQVKTLAVDCSNLDERACDALRRVIADVGDIGVLINNVGQSYSFPQYFHELPNEDMRNLITINITSTMVMTKLVLPGMVERKRGAIINCSSGSARILCPLLSEYSAAKKCIEQFSLCLADEYASKNIHIQCHTPMFVSTKLSKIRHSNILIPSPAKYAKAAVANIGYEALISPYWVHALQIWVYECIPSFIIGKMATMNHLGLRQRALKKFEQKKD